MARSVVSGRCVNGYSTEDWVLALRYSSLWCLKSQDASAGRLALALTLVILAASEPGRGLSDRLQGWAPFLSQGLRMWI